MHYIITIPIDTDAPVIRAAVLDVAEGEAVIHESPVENGNFEAALRVLFTQLEDYDADFQVSADEDLESDDDDDDEDEGEDTTG